MIETRRAFLGIFLVTLLAANAPRAGADDAAPASERARALEAEIEATAGRTTPAYIVV